MPGFVSIITPPVTAALTSLATAKADLNLSDYYVDDAYIAQLIDRASAVITRYCGRTFGSQTISETFRRNPSDYSPWNVASYGTPLFVKKPLVLTYKRVSSVTSVVENSNTLVVGTDYELDEAAGLVFRLYNGLRSTWGLTTVITYVSGYILPQDTGVRNSPYDLEEVCLSLIRGAYNARGSDPELIRELVEGVGMNQYNPNLTMSGMQIDENNALLLSPYISRVW